MTRYNEWAAACRPARRRWIEAALLLAVTIAARLHQFGNPAIQVDEQFYLLVGDRMLHGALPYVDIWDRKPIGLFLVYAAIRLLGGVGILQYQLVAGLAAFATAFLVTRTAGRIARPAGALAAGVLYLLYLNVFGGDGGQSPVFYNLPVTGAGALMAALCARKHFGRGEIALGCVVMALVGIAIQIKDTAVFEGLFFGLVLIGLAAARGVPALAILPRAALWVAIAVTPTALAFAAYAWMGQTQAFVFSNFVSIFVRGHPADSAAARLLHIVLMLLPLFAAIGLRPPIRPGESAPVRRFTLAWAVAACLGVLVFGSYFDHYALPLIAPLAIAAAPALDEARATALRLRGRTIPVPIGLIALVVAIVAGASTVESNRRARGTGPEQEALAAFIRPRLQGCLFVYDGEPILYHLTGSCLPTRWPFADHLDNISEDGAIGIDPLVEVRRIMANRPKLVVMGTRPTSRINFRTWTYMADALARDYRPVFAVPEGKRQRIVYERVAP